MGGEKVRNMTWGNRWKDLFLNELLSFHIIPYSFHTGKYWRFFPERSVCESHSLFIKFQDCKQRILIVFNYFRKLIMFHIKKP